MKFVTDGMLGKLTRWLRMLGHNVKYSDKLDDAQLITIAKKEQRILLTRDLELYRQAAAKGVQAFYVDEGTAENLAKIAQKFGISIDIDMARSRCPKCNARVKPVQKKRVVGKVKKGTFANYNEFWRCPKCGQIYWQGAHWTQIRKMLESARELSKKIERVKK